LQSGPNPLTHFVTYSVKAAAFDRVGVINFLREIQTSDWGIFGVRKVEVQQAVSELESEASEVGSLPMAGMLSPRKPPGDVQLESNRYTPVHFTPSQQQQTTAKLAKLGSGQGGSGGTASLGEKLVGSGCVDKSARISDMIPELRSLALHNVRSLHPVGLESDAQAEDNA
uniref:CPSF_A domain-containing protein n=1 Tax=Toxocara canis TaxID=6265 RepID=A0A183U1V1_TOXCA